MSDWDKDGKATFNISREPLPYWNNIMTPVQQLHAPVRTEAQEVADRIRRRVGDHIAAMASAGAIDREIASELLAKLNAECGDARPTLKVVT